MVQKNRPFNLTMGAKMKVEGFGLLSASHAPTTSVPDAVYARVYGDNVLVTAKRCPGVRPKEGSAVLFCTAGGRFFSLSGGGMTMREVLPSYAPSCSISKKNMHGRYPFMTAFGSRTCHTLVWETWMGPRTKGLQIDHMNGNKLDWRLENLEEVTPAENYKRATIIRAMRAAGNDPCGYTSDALREIFRKFEVVSPERIMDRDFSGKTGKEGLL